MISLKKNYIFIILVDLYASLSRFFLVPGSRSTFPEVDPDPAKWYGSDRIRIRIRNTGIMCTIFTLCTIWTMCTMFILHISVSSVLNVSFVLSVLCIVGCNKLVVRVDQHIKHTHNQTPKTDPTKVIILKSCKKNKSGKP